MIKLLQKNFDGTFWNISLFFFLGTLNSKQIAPASLFTFPLRIKTLRVIPYFFSEVLEATKHMEETENHQRVIRLIWHFLTILSENSCHFVNLLSFGNSYSFWAWDKSSDLLANSQLLEQMKTTLLLPTYSWNNASTFCRDKT